MVSEASRLDNAIPLHCVHALDGMFDPSVLKGRTVLTRNDIFLNQPLRIENPTIKKPAWGHVIDSQEIIAANNDDYKYYGAICVGGLQIRQKDAGKLVVTKDGDVLGILFATSSINDRVTGYVVPAYTLLRPPAEHIRESIRGQFDLARLVPYGDPVGPMQIKGHTKVSQTVVQVEGRDARERLSLNEYYRDVEIRGKKYTRGLSVHADSHFATKKDVGKLLLRRRSSPAGAKVVAIIADVQKDPNAKDRIIVHAVPAWTLTRGF